MSGIKGRSGGRRIGSGRRAFMPTVKQREQVAYLAQLGLSCEDILPLIRDQNDRSIPLDAFVRHFQEELKKGQAESLNRIITAMYRKAEAGHPACMMFILRCRGGWQEVKSTDNIASDRTTMTLPKMRLATFKKVLKDVTERY